MATTAHPHFAHFFARNLVVSSEETYDDSVVFTLEFRPTDTFHEDANGLFIVRHTAFSVVTNHLLNGGNCVFEPVTPELLAQLYAAPRTRLDTTDVRFVRRLARAINSECAIDGFYSGGRKFFGTVKVRFGRLMAREVGAEGGWTVDLTGIDWVSGNGSGRITASRRFQAG